MSKISEGQLKFDFPPGWSSSKFDEWSFYRNQFIKLGDACLNCSQCENQIRCAECRNKNVAGTKGIDILAIGPDSICWQIEIKDFRLTRVSSFEFLADEVALKVRDTLACLVAARLNAPDAMEKQFAKRGIGCNRLRVVLHLEQPRSKSSLESTIQRMANVKQKLKRLVKSIDPHPLVLDMNNMGTVDWRVTQK